MTMSKSRKTAFVFSVLLGLAVTQPLAVSFAASPNAINNQTAQLVSPVQSDLGPAVRIGPVRSGAGAYDQYDGYRTQNGFPLPGDSQLFEPID
jgi:hypothetical protein